MGAAAGGVVWPILLSTLIKSVGFGWMTRISGFIVLLFGSLATLILEARVPPRKGQSIVPDFKVLRNKSFTVLLLANMVGFFALFGIIFNIPTRAALVGVDPKLRPYILPILNVFSCFGRYVQPTFLCYSVLLCRSRLS